MTQDWRFFLFGGISSMIAESVTFPLDTIKTRLQIQERSASGHLKYTGLINGMRTITREEGVKVLYSGLKPALLRQATYGTLKFGIYKSLKEFMRKHGKLNNPETGEESFVISVLCAALAGATASAIANPTDLLKVRMQQYPEEKTKLISGFADIYHKSGVRGLWRGVAGTAKRAALLTAAGLPTYDYFKSCIVVYLGDDLATHISSASLASLCSALASTPFDVLRTRVMSDKEGAYKGIFDCLVKTVRHEGFFALYKGIIPTYIRMGPWSVAFFVTYEQLTKFF